MKTIRESAAPAEIMRILACIVATVMMMMLNGFGPSKAELEAKAKAEIEQKGREIMALQAQLEDQPKLAAHR
jgi:hypothetical protein